eukprot:CAMPEP_0178943356 /NCGR_PEP_ID=MMETSP0789-20121207/2541_1 /TAXON_ID=3005 /ORGANISM="Rhizosolenia setigera, Strain CCMP 1694" /LENGTH=861 /DNA_ID=CAMNT_0020622941 /DNA_START=41 /DNA_END=2623 /DNA_ORIENTATION=+
MVQNPSSHRHHSSSTTLSSSALEKKLNSLREKSNELSQTLTQKLATSQSGQNLLHIGPSLSTLPPDLHSLDTNFIPLLRDVEEYEVKCKNECERILKLSNEIRFAQKRTDHARECAAMYHDLLAAEKIVLKSKNLGDKTSIKDKISAPDNGSKRNSGKKQESKDNEDEDLVIDYMEYVSSLERAAYITLHLIQELKHCSDQTTSSILNPIQNQPADSFLASNQTLAMDSEKSRFLMTLSPRIRKLESDAIKALVKQLEITVENVKSLSEDEDDENAIVEKADKTSKKGNNLRSESTGEYDFWSHEYSAEEENLLAFGHCLRGLALLGRGKEAESAFARVAIIPLIRQRLSIGKLDEGGPRGQCTGLFKFLEDITNVIRKKFGNILLLTSNISHCTGVDLVTCGVWVPIATALMNGDHNVQMAIFSPGIANVLQANYTSIDRFLSSLSVKLLKNTTLDATANTSDNDSLVLPLNIPSVSPETIVGAQERIFDHSITREFYKKWNLPIYYQLRFAESCTRFNQALSVIQEKGWGESSVFSSGDVDTMMDVYGFEQHIFMELYDILLDLWTKNLKPLSHRFLRGSLQLIARMISFVNDGLDGKIQFGIAPGEEDGEEENDSERNNSKGYYWKENIETVAAVAWELTVLESCMLDDYPNRITQALEDDSNQDSGSDELTSVVSEILLEASMDISPLIEKMWNEIIVQNLIAACTHPLSAVKGVAATYRMTNRPPPTKASPFVSMILRPLKEFDENYASRTPPQVGSEWKVLIISDISEKYSVAVEELLETVKRTEVALKSRLGNKKPNSRLGFNQSGTSMSDGDKVKLQVYLDYQEFARHVTDVGVDVTQIPGVMKLGTLTVGAS